MGGSPSVWARMPLLPKAALSSPVGLRAFAQFLLAFFLRAGAVVPSRKPRHLLDGVLTGFTQDPGEPLGSVLGRSTLWGTL